MPGPTRYPGKGGMVAAPGKGVNVLELALYHGVKAKEIWVTATGEIKLFLNGEERKPTQIRGETLEFHYKGEGQDITGRRYGKIELLEVVGTGQFNLTVTQ